MYFTNFAYTAFSNVLLFDPSSLNCGFRRFVTFLTVKGCEGPGLNRCMNIGSSHPIYKRKIISEYDNLDINPFIITWVASFPTNRSQRVRIQVISQEKKVVPVDKPHP